MNKEKTRIGIFGGTFNPPHLGHVRLANEAAERIGADKMLIIPSCIPPHKMPGKLASGEERMEMCRLAFDDEIFEISSIELDRGDKSYTVETLRELKKLYPDSELYFIIGSDMLETFMQWYRWEEILSLATLCAASREEGFKADLSVYTPEQRERIIFLDFEPLEVSSTQIRVEIAKNAVPEYISPEVLKYIDVLVDGEFVLELKNPNLRFRGSANQRVIRVQESLKEDKVVLWDDEEGLFEGR